MALSNLVVRLELDDRNFKGKLEGSSDAIRRFQTAARQAGSGVERAEKATRSWGTALRDSIIVLGLSRHALLNLDALFLSIPKSILNANAQLEKMQALMRGLSGETKSFAAIQKEASEGMNFVFDASKNSPFDVQTVTDAFVKFRSAGLDPTNGSLQALIDSVARFGGSSEQMHRAAVAVQQMAGKGVISMEELRQQLGESVPTAMQQMARGLKIGLADMTNLISQGVVESASALQAMFRQMAIESGGAAAEMAQTWEGTVSRMKTQWVELSKVAGDAGFFNAAKDQLRELVDGFMKSAEAMRIMQQTGQVMASFVSIGGNVVRFLYEFGETIAFVAVSALASRFIPALQKSISEMNGGTGTIAKMRSEFQKLQTETKLTAEKVSFLAEREKAWRQGNANFAQYVYRNIETTNRWGNAMSSLGNAARVAGTAIKTFAWAAGAMVWQLAASMAAIWAIQKTIDHFTGATQKHAENLRTAAVAQITEDDVELIKEKIEELEEKRKDAADTQRSLQNTLRRTSGAENRASINQGIDRQKEKYFELTEAIEKYNSQLEQVALHKKNLAINKYVENEERQIGSQISPLRNKYTEAVEEEKKAILASGLPEDELKAQLAESHSRLTNLHRESIERLFEERREAFARESLKSMLKDGTVVDKEIDVMRGRLRDAYDDMKQNTLSPFEMPDTDININAGRNKAAAESFAQFVNSIDKKLTRVKSRVTDVNPHLEEFMRRLESEQFGKLDVNSDPVKDLIEKLKELHEQEKTWKAQEEAAKKFETSIRSLDVAMAAIQKKGKKSLNDNPFAKNTINAEADKEKIQGILGDLAKIKGASKETQTAIDGILSRSSEFIGDIGDIASGLDQKDLNKLANDIRTELLPATQRLGVETKEQIDLLNEWFSTQENIKPDTVIAYGNAIGALNAKLARETEKPIQKLARGWKENTQFMDEVWKDTMSGFVDTLTDGLIEGEFRFDSFFKTIASMIIKAQLQQAIGGLVSNLFAPAGPATLNQGKSVTGTSAVSSFANGGIMTSEGPMLLKKYANGGIANRPQLALFGEGSQNEAFVPLPDGRNIPVKLTGEQQNNKAPEVSVNVINTTGVTMDAQSSTPRWNGQQMVLDVVLGAMSKPGKFRDNMRGAVR